MQNRKLLVLEKESELVKTFQTALSSQPTATQGNNALAMAPAAQFDVHYVATPDEAVIAIVKSVVEKRPYSGAFLDLEFGPGKNGSDVLAKVRLADPKLLAIVVTNQFDAIWETLHQQFADEFADRWDIISKPCSRGQLFQKAQRTITSWERRSREREHLEQIERNEAQLISSERLATIGTLARGIGHDFGNLLQQMMVKCEVALQKKDPVATEEAVKFVLANGERASAVVRNLQSLVRTETGREMVSLETPLKEATQLIEFEMKKTKVKLVLEYDRQPLPTLKMNKFEINQVFLNLMVNAVHAMEAKGGELKVKTLTDDKGITIMISDSGCGIPQENLQKIWEPLFTTKAGKGSGIGLSVTRKIIENHGGKVTLTSIVGQGTTFHIWLPKT